MLYATKKHRAALSANTSLGVWSDCGKRRALSRSLDRRAISLPVNDSNLEHAPARIGIALGSTVAESHSGISRSSAAQDSRKRFSEFIE